MPDRAPPPDAELLALAARLQRACLARGLTVATAESCTGGMVATTLTEVPGSSGYVLGGVVSYANAVKTSMLGVPDATLAEHGAVSRETAAAMASGARDRLGASLGVGITGVAGPDGGSVEKPVGLVYVGVSADDGEASVRRFRFDGDRAAIRRAATWAAIAWLVEVAEA